MRNQNTNNFAEALSLWITGHGFGSVDSDFSPNVDLQTLEDRVLYSASPLPLDFAQPSDVGESVCDVADCFESVETQFIIVSDALEVAAQDNEFSIESTLGAGLEATGIEPILSNAVTSNELVIVDTSVEGYEQLVNDLLNQSSTDRAFEVVFLSPESEGVGKISSILAGKSGLDAIHLVTHGSDGQLQLGQTVLNESSLDGFEYEISQWRNALDENADILIYGCDVAESSVGESFVEQLSLLLDSDIAASSDVTGHASLGGDWYFEFSVGVVETELAFSDDVTSNWNQSLGVVAIANGGSVNGAVAADYVGNLTIVGSSDQVIGSVGDDIYLTTRDTAGTDLITNQRVNALTAGNQTDAVIAMADSGDFVVVWTSDVGGSNNIFAQIYDSDGTVEVSEFQVNEVGFNAENASVAMTNDGQIVIAWQGSGANDADGIYAKRFNKYGDELSAILDVNAATALDQVDSDIAINEAGEFVVAWTDFNGTASTQEAKFSIFGADNLRVVTDEIAHSLPLTYFEAAAVAIDDDRHVVIAATALPTDPAIALEVLFGTNVLSENVLATIFDYDASWNFGVADKYSIDVHNLDQNYGQQHNSAVTITNGEVLITWETEGGVIDGDGLYYRTFDIDDGTAISAVSTFRGSTDEFESNAALVSFHNNEAWAVVWEDSQPSATIENEWSQTYTNAAPTGQNGSAPIDEDAVYVFGEADFGYNDGEFPLLGEIEFNSIPSSGVLRLNGTALESGDEVTGDDIRSGNLTYLPEEDANSLTLTPGSTSFSFTVNDGYLDALTSNTFEFNIAPVNDAPTTAVNSGSSITQGTIGNVITTAMLNEGDVDDDGAGLVYTVTSTVTSGDLIRNGTLLSDGMNFTQADVDLGLLTYNHNGSDAPTDSFSFSLADGGEDGALPFTGQFDFTIDIQNYAPTDLTSGIEINADGGNNLYFAVNDGNSTSLLNGLTSLTVESSFAIAVAPLDAATLFSYNVGSSDEFTIQIEDDGDLRIFIKDSNYKTSDSYPDLLDGKRHHVAISWNSDGGILQIFVDGEFVETIDDVDPGEALASNGVLVLGQEQDASNGGFDASEAFQGTLFDVRIWNEDRTANEIASNYSQKLDASNIPSSLIANWQMAELAAADDVVVDLVNPGVNDLKLLGASGGSFLASTASDVLSISEAAANNESVGTLVPTDIEFVENIVQDGSFNSYEITNSNYTTFAFDGSEAGSQFGAWTVVANAIDVRGTNWELSPDGGRAVDLVGGSFGGTNGQGIIEQTLTTVIGQEYEISFEMSGNFEGGGTQHDLSVNVDGAGNVFSFVKPGGWSRDNLQWEQQVLTFTATDTSTVLQFEALTGSYRGAIIGDVNVVESTSVVPGNYSFQMIDDAAGRFQINSATGEITVLDASLLNFDLAASHDVTVKVIDSAGPSYQETMTIFVTDFNQSPTVATNAGLTIDEGAPQVTITNLMLNEGDPDDEGAGLTYTITETTTNGILRIGVTTLVNGATFTQADIDAGQLSYEHDGNENLGDSFEFELIDGGEDGSTKVTETFMITVNPINDAPTLVLNNGIAVQEGAAGNTILAAMLNHGDPDDDGTQIVYTLTSPVSNGTLRVNGNALGNGQSFTQFDIDNGLVKYDHDGGESTGDAFSFSMADGGEDGASPVTDTFLISVSPVNDTPTFASNGATFNEGSLNNTITTGMLNELDPDDDGTGLTYSITTNVTRGTLYLNGAELFANDTFSQDDIDSARLTYDHGGGELTTDQFAFSLEDGGENGALPASGTFDITLTPVNDAPTFVSNGATLYQATSGNVITNAMLFETDPDDSGTGLTYTITTAPNEGTLFLNGFGALGTSDTFTQSDIEGGLISYNHAGVGSSPDSFQFTLEDGGEDSVPIGVGTFNITVIAVGTDAIAVDDNISVDEDGTFDSIVEGQSLFANDFDNDGDPFKVLEFTGPSNGTVDIDAVGNFVYSPNNNYNGPDSFSYSITDQIDGLQHHWGLGENAIDLVGGADGAVNGTTSLVGDYSGASFFDEVDDYIAIPDVTYGSNFTVTFDFKIDDNSGSDYQYLYSHGDVAVNDSLNIYLGESSNASNSNLLKTALFDGNDTPGVAQTNLLSVDISALIGDSSWHRYTLVVEQGVGATVYIDGTISASSTQGSDGVDPAGDLLLGTRNDFQVDRFYGGGLDTLQIYDRAFSATDAADLTRPFSQATVNVTVDPVNDDPTAVDDEYHVGKGHATTIVAGSGLLYNDSDIDGDSISASFSNVVDTEPLNGMVTVNPDGSFTYTHDGSNTTTDLFTYTLTDSQGGTHSATVFLEIEEDGLTQSNEFLVNQDIANSPIGSVQDTHLNGSYADSAVATAANGDYVIVWTGSDGTSETVYMRMFDFSGTPLTESIAVSASMTTGDNHGAAVSMAADGSFVVVWANENGATSSWDGTGSSIYYQTFNADGTQSNTIQKATDLASSSGSQVNADVSMNASGQFAITWSGDGVAGDGDDVFINVIDSDGLSLTGGTTQLNSVAGSSVEQNVSVVMADNGTVAAFWDDGNVIHGKAFDTSGAFDVATTTELIVPLFGDVQEIKHSSLAFDNGSGLLAVAVQVLVPDGGIGTQWETHLQLIDLSAPTIVVNSFGNQTLVGDQTHPSVSFGNDGKLVMTWQGNGIGDSNGVFVRRFEVDYTQAGNPTAIPISTEFFVNQTIGGTQEGASVSAIDSQNFVVVWSGEGSGDSNGIFARQFGTQASSQMTGRVVETDFVKPADDTNASVNPDVGVAGATVKLYRDNGDGVISIDDRLVREVQTGASGYYSFDNLENGETYWVVVDSKTIQASASLNGAFTSNDVWAEQVYGDGAAKIGGLQAGVSDDASSLMTSQHVSHVAVDADVTGIDFGFSFNVVTNALAGGNQDDDTGVNDRSVQGSLRQFITNANAIDGRNEMHFVPGVTATETNGGDSWWEVAVANALPEITDAETIIDGRAYDSDGVTRFNSNTMLHGSAQQVGIENGPDGIPMTADDYFISLLDAPELEIYTTDGVSIGFNVNASDVEIAYVSIHGFGSGANQSANIFVASGGDGVLIHHNMIGTTADLFDAASTQADSKFGIFVKNADDGVISDNLIGFTGKAGIKIQGSTGASDPAENWVIAGNEIRSNASVSANFDGIDINFSVDNISVIGNLIADNFGYGVDTWNSTGGVSITDNTIVGNGLGGQEIGGVRLFGSGNEVSRNTISGNEGAGVHVVGDAVIGADTYSASTGNLISQNSFFENSGLAIDLSSPGNDSTEFNQGDGLTANDGSVDNITGNDGLDHPMLTAAHIEADGLHLYGFIQGTFATRSIELYIADSGAGDYDSGTPYGEGATYLSTLDLSNVVSFNLVTGEFELLLPTPAGGWSAELLAGSLTALTIDTLNNNTSEFGNAEEVDAGSAPVITTGQDLFIDENKTALGKIEATDSENDDISFSITGGADELLFSINSNNGRLRFIGAPDFEFPTDGGASPGDNIYEVEVTATDETNRATSQLFMVHVENVDEAPTAIDDIYVVQEGGSFTQDVTTNDVDPENSSFIVTIKNKPNYGSAFVNADGKVVYLHNGSETTTDQFVYRITDAGGNVAQATVYVTITPVDDPTYVVDDRIAVEYEQPKIITRNSILKNDIDPDTSQANMNISIVQGPVHGSLTIVSGQLVFIPDAGFAGSDLIKYQVESGGTVSNTGTIVILVGGPPANPADDPVDDDPVDETPNDDEPTGDGNPGSNDDDEDQPDTRSNLPPKGFNDKLANTIGKENDANENGATYREFKIDQTGTTYSYANRGDDLSLENLAEILVSSRSSESVSQFETTLLAGLQWDDMDSSSRNLMQAKLQLGVHEIAASAASFLTVGYLAWIIRGGVLLTTFMSSIPTWSVFDIQSVIEAAGGGDESIEQMVDR